MSVLEKAFPLAAVALVLLTLGPVVALYSDINPATRTISVRSLDKHIARAIEAFGRTEWDRTFRSRVRHIAIPRRVGSVGHRTVRKFIESSLHDLSSRWVVREDRFWIKRNERRVRFQNVIATFEPPTRANCSGSVRRIVLACHYDSLSTRLARQQWSAFPRRHRRRRRFLGAIDAAVPCSLLLDLAQFITPQLEKYHFKAPKAQPLTLQLIFFDGEEALESSREGQGLFGSQHLARVWARNESLHTNQLSDETPKERCYRLTQKSLYNNANIAIFILLDLIGVTGTKFYNTNLATTRVFRELAFIEKNLLRHLNMSQTSSTLRQFQTNPPLLFSLVKDDHQPFLLRNVPTLALIPHPFPQVWHRTSDDLSSLDLAAIERLKTVLAAWLSQQFQSRNLIVKSQTKQRQPPRKALEGALMSDDSVSRTGHNKSFSEGNNKTLT